MSICKDVKDYFTVKEAARLLGCHPNTVYAYIEGGLIGTTRAGIKGRYRLNAEDVRGLYQ